MSLLDAHVVHIVAFKKFDKGVVLTKTLVLVRLSE